MESQSQAELGTVCFDKRPVKRAWMRYFGNTRPLPSERLKKTENTTNNSKQRQSQSNYRVFAPALVTDPQLPIPYKVTKPTRVFLHKKQEATSKPAKEPPLKITKTELQRYSNTSKHKIQLNLTKQMQQRRRLQLEREHILCPPSAQSKPSVATTNGVHTIRTSILEERLTSSAPTVVYDTTQKHKKSRLTNGHEKSQFGISTVLGSKGQTVILKKKENKSSFAIIDPSKKPSMIQSVKSQPSPNRSAALSLTSSGASSTSTSSSSSSSQEDVSAKEVNYKKRITKGQIAEENILASCAKRNGNKAGEAQCYLNMTHLCVNISAYQKAIKYCTKYLEVVKELNETLSEAIAYNLLAVNYFYLGGEDNLRKSVEFNNLHNEITRDPVSKFVANVNLGICLSALGKYDTAVSTLRIALGYAIHLGDVESQRVACHHLSVAAMEKNDFPVATMYLERVLKATVTSGDKLEEAKIHLLLGEVYIKWKGKCSQEAKQQFTTVIEISNMLRSATLLKKALLCLGEIAMEEGDFETAIRDLKEVLALAEEEQDEASANRAKILLGIAEGNAKFQHIMHEFNRDTIPSSLSSDSLKVEDC